MKHGAKPKRPRCTAQGCTNQVKRGGLCHRHGTYHRTNDGSTAFGSEFDMVNTIHLVFRATVREGQEGESVPGEVTILCEEIADV